MGCVCNALCIIFPYKYTYADFDWLSHVFNKNYILNSSFLLRSNSLMIGKSILMIILWSLDFSSVILRLCHTIYLSVEFLHQWIKQCMCLNVYKLVI